MFRLEYIEEIIFQDKEVTIDPEALDRVRESYDFLAGYASSHIIYGVNTGFGPMAQYRVGDGELEALQYNIIRSHACGAGRPLEDIYVRAAILCRMHTFLKGKSGVHPSLPLLLAGVLNNGIYPVIPEHGSVGASGDLVQLAHMALSLIGEGEARVGGRKTGSAEALSAAGLKPLRMYIREGLAVTNGTSVMTGIGLVNLLHAKRLTGWAILASVTMNEIAASYNDFMAPELNGAKHHPGQQEVAQAMNEISRGSRRLKERENVEFDNVEGAEIFRHKVQPFYSLRCVPQILGPVVDQLKNTEKVLVDEFNSADDNPIVDPVSLNVYHGGNFHGDYISFEMDKLKTAVTKMTMLAERQMNYIFHDKINGILPPFLNLGKLGLDYGLQAAQFTATSTTAECQTLSNPMYVHSIPNNNDNQDIVSMGTNSALIAAKVVDNAYQVMAIHFISLAQAVDCLAIRLDLSPQSRRAYDRIREIIPVIKGDAPLYEGIAKVESFLRNQNPCTL
ncbi:MAG: aromatic amino acid ammonia-lyase [Rikenellaceae bacterium]|nr:aromatic amino acid ammonia-lyase [Rikenellaceae bacterium]